MGNWAAALKTTLTIVSLVVFWNWETYRPLTLRRPRRWLHATRNLTIALLNAVFLAIAVAAPLAYAISWAAEERLGLLRWLNTNRWCNLILTVVLLDGWMYLWHRMNHGLPFLWRFHQMHHSDKEMDVTTATRFHLGEHLIGALVRFILMPLLGATLTDMLIYETIVVVATMFHHANITLGNLDRPLRILFVTPRMHQVHHSRWQPETDSNYSVVFSFWDRIGRSFRMRPNHETIAMGLDGMDDDRWQTVAGMLKTPFIRK